MTTTTFQCTYCGCTEYVGGPRGGLSQNVYCARCRHWFNLTPFGLDDLQRVQPKRWIKIPRPGEFRGSGQWFEIEETAWRWDDPLIQGGFLPTHEGDAPPGPDDPEPVDCPRCGLLATHDVDAPGYAKCETCGWTGETPDA